MRMGALEIRNSGQIGEKAVRMPQGTAKHIRNLAEPLDAMTFGAKAESLGKLHLLGYDMPRGFAVSKGALEEFLALSGLEARIRIMLESRCGHGVAPGKLAEAADEIRRLMLSAEISGDLRESLVGCYRANFANGTTYDPVSVLFSRIAGLIVDKSPLLQHAAIVAREAGIPAVLNTCVATRELKDGQMVTIDGSNGRVTIISEHG